MSTSPNPEPSPAALRKADLCRDYNRVLNHLRRLRDLWARTPSLNVQRRTETKLSVWGRRARELKELQ